MEPVTRAVSSGVEHDIHTVGVAGSKPAPPTNLEVPRSHLAGRDSNRLDPVPREQRYPFFGFFTSESQNSPGSESGGTSSTNRPCSSSMEESRQMFSGSGNAPALG